MYGFEKIFGQDRSVSILTRLIQGSAVPHALLFFGADGVGKRSCARAFATGLNCAARRVAADATKTGEKGFSGAGFGDESKDPCSSCRRFAKGAHPDFIEISPDKSLIKIERIRELCRVLTLKPYEALFRVVILAQAHFMNEPAANALLKVLEEPPDQTVFILTARQTSDLLPTIVSRCQYVRFDPLPAGKMAEALAKESDLSFEKALRASRLARGSLTAARKLAAGAFFRKRTWLLGELARLGPHRPALALALAEKLAQFTDAADDLLPVIGSWIRDLAVAQNAPDHIFNDDYKDRIMAAARTTPMDQAFVLHRAFVDLESDFGRKANARMAWESFFLKMTGGADGERAGFLGF